MDDVERQRRTRRIRRQVVYGSLVLLAFVCAAWYFTSDSFREYIRHRLTVQLEDATGGRVEIGRIQWNLARLRVQVESLTIHGLEGPADPPLLHVNRIDARLRLTSLIGRRVNFRALDLDSPSINLIVYPDGRTNQPSPRVSAWRSRRSLLDPLFEVSVRRFSVKNGLLRINEQKTPFDFFASDLGASIGYQSSPECYTGAVQIGKFDTQWKALRPFSATANIQFQLYRNALELRSAKFTSERSELSLDGKLTNFAQPTVSMNYSGKLDLRQLGAVTRVFEFQAGMLEANGQAKYDSLHTDVRGNLQLTEGAWNHPAVHLGGVSGTAAFVLDQDRLQVSQIVANALGGRVNGDLTVMHWNTPPHETRLKPATAKERVREHSMEAREQSAEGKFEFRGLQLDKIAALFATLHLPLSSLHPSGIADGTAELTWAGSPQASELKLDVRAIPGEGQLPVTAHLDGTYSFPDRSMQIAQAEFHTAATHLNATGYFGARSLDLELGLTTANLHEIQPLLESNGLGRLPVQINGEASFQGSVEGRPSLPTINGHLRLADFTTVLLPNAPGKQAELVKALHKKSRAIVVPPVAQAPSGKTVRFHWDSFDGYVTYGPDAASVQGAVLKTGSARFEIAASTTLQDGGFTNASQFRGSTRIRQARMDDLQTLLGINYPITGTVNAELQMSGTRIEPRGSGKLSLVDGTAYGQPLQSLSTDLTFSGREAQFTNFHARSDAAQADGSGSINVSSEHFNFDLRGSNVDLLRVTFLQTPKVKLTGVLAFNAHGSGMLSAPAISGDAVVHNISLGGKHEGDLNISATTHGEQMELTASSQFVTAKLNATGRIRLRDNFDSDITVKFGNVDLQPFLEGIARGHSSIDGSFHVTGPLRYPAKLDARLEIPRYESEVETVVLHNSGPIVASYHDGVAHLESLRLTGDATDLSSSGTVQLVDGQAINMRADGRANLKLLQSFNPEIVSYGQTSVSVQVGGSMHDPALRGRITIEHAGISYVDMPNGLSDLNGSFVFNENRLQVEKLTAHTGGGDLNVAGFIAYGRTVSFNLTATGKDVRIRYPEGVSANGDADLRLAGTLKNATLSGQVTINKFGLNPRFDFAYYLTRSRQIPATPNPESPLNNLHFDVHVVSAPELQVQTSLARLTGDVDLRVRGSAMRPAVLGRITIVEGDVTFNGTKYRLDRGDILFSNPSKIDPILDLEASARVSDYDISIGLHGTVDKLNTTYRSDPPLPTADVFALLAFGRTSDVSYTSPQSNAYTESASSAVLGSALNAAVSSRVQKLFGASRIKIDPEVGGAENNPNARITVEQQVSGNITLTYITNLAQSAQQVIQFQYNVNRNVSIVGVRDEYGVIGFEVQIRQRKR
ncbi:MAG TPA: translocation/assembly module TamB domain-containing protein [Candidatus Koribacter sp.]|jgi:translocation and assembly module TamB